MLRRRLPLLLLLAAAPAGADDLPGDVVRRARKLQADAIVIDTHEDVPDQLGDKYRDVALRGATDHFDLPRAREGGLGAVFFSIFVSSDHADDGTSAGRALELIDVTRRVVAEHPKDMVLAASVAEIRQAKRDGKLAVLMGLEGGHALEDSPGAMRELYHAGVRYVTLTHVNSNHWADSAGPFLPDFEPQPLVLHHGLTDLGKEMVRAMNKAGMIVDVSHVSAETLAAVLAVSTAPVMASHSSCRALNDMPRNLTDAQIAAIAAKGGVVMINFSSSFLDPSVYAALSKARDAAVPAYEAAKKQHAGDRAALKKAEQAILEGLKSPRADWTRLVDHIEHAMKVGGPKAIGLGSDFDGIGDPPSGMDDVSMLPRITEELLRRGHSEAEVRGVLGENFLAFFARVEAAAAQAR